MAVVYGGWVWSILLNKLKWREHQRNGNCVTDESPYTTVSLTSPRCSTGVKAWPPCDHNNRSPRCWWSPAVTGGCGSSLLTARQVGDSETPMDGITIHHFRSTEGSKQGRVVWMRKHPKWSGWDDLDTLTIGSGWTLPAWQRALPSYDRSGNWVNSLSQQGYDDLLAILSHKVLTKQHALQVIRAFSWLPVLSSFQC